MRMILKISSKENGIDEEKEDRSVKCWMCGPATVTELEAGIIQGREHEFVVNMTNVRAPTSSFTNMRILDKEHATNIYSRLLTKKNVASLTLRPMAYYDERSGEEVVEISFMQCPRIGRPTALTRKSRRI